MARGRAGFDPRTILGALERAYGDYVVIGGLAQVLRGADIVTWGVDICPSFARGNLARIQQAVAEFADDAARKRFGADGLEDRLAAGGVVSVATSAGEIRMVGAPAGIPNGFVELRRAASREDLGGGLRPLVASTGDLAAMAAALGRPQDLERLGMLRRVVELEARRQAPERRPAVGVPSTARRSTRRVSR